MAWNAPTITQRHSRDFTHTQIHIDGVFEGTTAFSYDLTNMPVCIIGGTIMGTGGGTGGDTQTLLLRSGSTTVSNTTEQNIMHTTLTNGIGVDKFTIHSIFEQMAATAGYVGETVCLPTNELRIIGLSSDATDTTSLINAYISLISYRMEV